MMSDIFELLSAPARLKAICKPVPYLPADFRAAILFLLPQTAQAAPDDIQYDSDFTDD